VVCASWSAAQADVLIVTNTNDSGPGSLRQCIADAQPGDEIQFDPSLDGRPIVLTSGELVIDRDLILTGRGTENTIVSGNSSSRVLQIQSGSIANISHVMVTDGSVYPGGGGGILNLGDVTLTNVMISDCFAEGGGGIANLELAKMAIKSSTIRGSRAEVGGGIANAGSMTVTTSAVNDNWGFAFGGGVFNRGVLTIIKSTVSSNLGGGFMSRYGEGGGVWNGYDASLRITDSTVSGNVAEAREGAKGGGILNQDGALLTVMNSTISMNLVDWDPRRDGGNISNVSEATFGNSIVGYGSCRNEGAVHSLGHNLDYHRYGHAGCGFNHPTDLTDTDPMLGSLQDNGGLTSTHEPLTGSPVIDAGWCDPGTDQRGAPRPLDGNRDGVWICDIGSVEYIPYEFVPIGEPGDGDIIIQMDPPAMK
jgi:hypothetical protein